MHRLRGQQRQQHVDRPPSQVNSMERQTKVQEGVSKIRMKFKESDTGGEQYYTQFAGIELDEIGEWHLDRNNIAPCEWTMCNKEYIEWFLSAHPKPVDIREATR